ncbi:MAG: hypothetical protein K8R88_03770 [Armatimonadetes bacterium]|nr:hypothetical protein [Armatimonadota bacterium]
MQSNHRLTLETKVWEKDWRRLILLEECKHIFERILTPCHRRLLINNVEDPKAVAGYAEKLVAKGILDEVVIVDSHIEAALTHFKLSKESLGIGFAYSAAELVGIFTCETEYLAHFAGDCRMLHYSHWCEDGMNTLAENNDIAVVNPIWNGDVLEVEKEATERVRNYCLGYGFSDQCYLVRTMDLLNADLTQIHPDSRGFPAYGGELFEKRVDGWMRTEGRLRATDLTATYVHGGQL